MSLDVLGLLIFCCCYEEWLLVCHVLENNFSSYDMFFVG